MTTAEIERIWGLGRREGGRSGDWRRPSPGLADVLVTLSRGATYAGDLARRTSRDQGTLSGQWLPKLERFGLVARADAVPGLGGQGGGRPAQLWRLTQRGRELADLLIWERG